MIGNRVRLAAPDNAPASEVLNYILMCARLWSPEARIIGNARAGDIVRALEAAHARAEAVGVKPLDAARLSEAEREITEYQRERSRWIDYATDLQRIIEALCNRRALPEPVSTARHHYEMARSALAHPAVPEGWQPIETAPKDGDSILVTQYIEDEGGWFTFIVDSMDDEFVGETWGISRSIAPFTHWQHLPTPPTVQKDEGE